MSSLPVAGPATSPTDPVLPGPVTSAPKGPAPVARTTSLPKRGRGRPRKHPLPLTTALPTLAGKRALTPADLDTLCGIGRATLRMIPTSVLPRVEINERVFLYLAEDVEKFLADRKVA